VDGHYPHHCCHGGTYGRFGAPNDRVPRETKSFHGDNEEAYGIINDTPTPLTF